MTRKEHEDLALRYAALAASRTDTRGGARWDEVAGWASLAVYHRMTALSMWIAGMESDDES